MANPKITVEIGSSTKQLDADLKKIIETNKKQNRQLKDTQKRTAVFSVQQAKAEKEIAKLRDKHHRDQEKQKKQAAAEHRRQHQALVRAEKQQHRDRVKADRERAVFLKKERAEELRWNKRVEANQRGYGSGGGRFAGQGRKINDIGGRVIGSGLRSILGVGAGLMGYAVGAGTTAYGQRNDFHKAMSASIGLGVGTRVSRGVNRAGGAALGFNRIDSAHMNPLMAQATGALGPRELQQGMRATGMDQGAVAGIFGSMARAGTSFQGGEFKKSSAGGREFAKLIAAGMESGLEKGRLPEFAEGVMSLVDQRGTMASGDVSASAIASQLTALGQTGLSGFKGERGANMLSKINQSFTKAGGGEWGDNFMRMAMGFGKPGGTTGFYEAEKMREKGVEDPQNMSRVLGEVTSQFGGGKEGALALRELTGVSLQQAEDLLKLQKDGGVSKDNLEKISKVMDEGLSIEDRSLKAMEGIGSVVKRLATRQDMFIAFGEAAAPIIEAIEDEQMKLLLALKPGMEALVETARVIVGNFMGDSSDKIKSDIIKARTDRESAQKDWAGKTPAQIQELELKKLKAARDAYRQDSPHRGVAGAAKSVFVLGDDHYSIKNPFSTQGFKGKLTTPANRAMIQTENEKAAVEDILSFVEKQIGPGPLPPELSPLVAGAASGSAAIRESTGKLVPHTPGSSADARVMGPILEALEKISKDRVLKVQNPDPRSPMGRVER